MRQNSCFLPGPNKHNHEKEINTFLIAEVSVDNQYLFPVLSSAIDSFLNCVPWIYTVSLN